MVKDVLIALRGQIELRNYESLYKKGLKSRRLLKKKYHAVLEEIYETEGNLRDLTVSFESKLNDKVKQYVDNYEGWLKDEVYRWKEHHARLMARLTEKEDEIERLRNGNS